LDNSKKEIEKIIKPKMISGIILSLVCLGPFGNLLFNIATKNYNRLMIYAMLTLPTLIIIGVYWCWHITKRINLNHDVEEIQDLLNDHVGD
jgi:hypothetical protein